MATSRMTSTISESGPTRGRYFRSVDRFVHHGEPLGFRELCIRAVPESTRYLVFDLDRTLHLARNMGELLGWETAAHHSYGAEHLAAAESRRGPGRFLIDPRHPLGTARYVYRGARGWAYPGMFYLLWGRMAGASAATRRMRARRFGSDAYLYIQTLPNLALLHDLADMPLDEARDMSARVFRRQVADQVVDRSDIEWLRARCPNAEIILSSASPRPVVEAAGRELGIESTLYTEIDVHEGRISAPYHTSSAFLRKRHPRRICPPSAYRINSGREKVDRMVSRYPDILDSETVGITDTWHGDDHCWAHHFRRVVDVNSISPFSPLVSVQSPVEEIHSAQLLTVEERQARDAGDTEYVSPRRQKIAQESACDLTAAEVSERVSKVAVEAERRAARYARLRDDLAPRIAEVDAEMERHLGVIEEVVDGYNRANAAAQHRLLRSLAKLTRQLETVRRRSARVQRPLSELALELSGDLDSARRQLTGAPEDVLWRDVFLAPAAAGGSQANGD